ncbi:MAG: acyl carrier protein [Holophagales bacterium]|nr:acyl carrier protein [Holophagales bacterium]MYA08706.1 acyl carrier protein [Holophagales bacterium]MYF95897.1 acyl carrier protein [Holophagales bacterium]MYG29890.1 acyl carrier protein [Holophagales bacterium]MYI79304.1 acyl carrier protein [Holophagales bacterium]
MDSDGASEILARLRDVLRESAVEEHDWDAVVAETPIESLGFDSLTILDVLYDVEEEFGIALDPKQVVKTRTIGEIIALLQQNGA